MVRFLLTIFLFLAAQQCFAQFNDTTHYYVNYSATGSINRATGNNTYLLNNGLKFSAKEQKNVINFTNSWIYGRTNNVLTNNDFSSAIDFDLHTHAQHFYYWGLANYVTSVSLKINSELLAGLGAAYNIVDKKNALLNISDGVVYDNGDLYTQINTRDVYHTYRNSFRIMYHFAIKDMITLDGSNFYQESFSRSDDYIIRSNNTLGVKLKKWLTLTASLAYNRMNRTYSENTLFTYGLTFEKYF